MNDRNKMKEIPGEEGKGKKENDERFGKRKKKT